MLAVGGQDDDAEAGDLYRVASMNAASRLALDGLQISCKVMTCNI